MRKIFSSGGEVYVGIQVQAQTVGLADIERGCGRVQKAGKERLELTCWASKSVKENG